MIKPHSKRWIGAALAICLMFIVADVVWISSSTTTPYPFTIVTFVIGALAAVLLLSYGLACRSR